MDFDGMVIFSETKHTDRHNMSEEVTAWRQRNASATITDIRTMQSSDNAFHCVTVIIFYKNKK